jgi:hypothetical protein
VADDRLAARVRATRAHRVRGSHPDLADRLTAPPALPGQLTP